MSGLSELAARDLLTEFQKQFDGGFSRIFIDILTCTTGGTYQKMYQNSRPVRSVTVQNITTTAATLVSIITSLGTGTGGNSATQGILLNPGSAQNTGGGSWSETNIDLEQLHWTATNSSDKITVAYKVSGYSGISKPGTVKG